jgi:hypothetical protein
MFMICRFVHSASSNGRECRLELSFKYKDSRFSKVEISSGMYERLFSATFKYVKLVRCLWKNTQERQKYKKIATL